ncbi:hypothetical protein K2X85_01995 [bacterium]|nr:hypothetical protein [bacterium]
MEGKPASGSPPWNPYCEWLAIPPSHDPTTPAQLLGLGTGPSDLERVQRAGQRQLRRIEPHLHGPHADVAVRILREITDAIESLTKQLLSLGPEPQPPGHRPTRCPTEETDSVTSEELDVLVFDEPSGWPTASTVMRPNPSPSTFGLGRVLLLASMVTLAVLSSTAVLFVWRGRSVTTDPALVAVERPAPLKPEPASNAVVHEGCWRLVRTVPVTTWDEAPKGVESIELAKSPADESFPSMSPSGLGLLFTRRVGAEYEIHRLTRPSTADAFHADWVCSEDSTRTVCSMTWAGEDRWGLCRPTREGLDFMELSISASDGRPIWRSMGLPVRGAEGDLFLSLNGRSMLFSRKLDRVYHIFESRRADRQNSFEPPLLTPVSSGYRHPCLSRDEKLLLVEGLASDGRVAIFASRRPSTRSAWGGPVCLEKIRSTTGSRGDFTPRLTPDEKYLLFASDRAGGAGMLDLYRVAMKEAIPAWDDAP